MKILQIEITDQECYDILTNGIETHGIDYWALDYELISIWRNKAGDITEHLASTHIILILKSDNEFKKGIQTMTTIFNDQARIQVSDIDARIEELESVNAIEFDIDNLIESEEATELVTLRELRLNIGNDGDQLIHDGYEWKNYIIEEWEQVVDDSNLPDLLKTNIDWQGAADDASSNYTSVDFDGESYLVV